MRHHSVTGGGGTRLNVIETGDPGGLPILFVHGWSQSHAVWQRQLLAPALQRFRLVAFDLRGHGDSDKPHSGYDDGARWAADVTAVVDALALARPVVVGWSYGGYVVCDYLREHGDGGLGGLVFVAAATDMGAGAGRPLEDGWIGILPDKTGAPNVFSPGAEEAAIAMRRFVQRCFAAPLDHLAELEWLGIALCVPPRVREALFRRRLANDDVLAAIRVPTLIVHGDADRFVDVDGSRHLDELVTHAVLSIYPGIGHTPFWEATERFDRELAAFGGALAAA